MEIKWTDQGVLDSNFFDPTRLQMMVLTKLRDVMETKVFWSCWAPSHLSDKYRFLVCGNSSGVVEVYTFSHSSFSPLSIHPTFKFQAHSGPIYCYEWLIQQKSPSNSLGVAVDDNNNSYVSTEQAATTTTTTLEQQQQSSSNNNNNNSNRKVCILFTGGDQEIRAWNFTELLLKAETVATAAEKRTILEQTLTTTISKTPDVTSFKHLSAVINLLSCTFELEMKADEQYITDRGFALERVECNALCYDSNSEKLFSVWGDGNIYVWEVETGQKLSKLSVCVSADTSTVTTKCEILSLCIANNMLFAGCDDGSIRVWDTNSEEMVETLTPLENSSTPSSSTKYPISCIAVDDNSNWLAFSGGMAFVVLMNMATRTITSILPTSANVNALKFTSDGRLISVGNERNIMVWDMTGRLVAKYETEIPAIYSVSFDDFYDSNLKRKNVMTAVGAGTKRNIYINDMLTTELIN